MIVNGRKFLANVVELRIIDSMRFRFNLVHRYFHKSWTLKHGPNTQSNCHLRNPANTNYTPDSEVNGMELWTWIIK